MFYHESWKPIYFEIEKVTRHKNVAVVDHDTFVSACFCFLLVVFCVV